MIENTTSIRIKHILSTQYVYILYTLSFCIPLVFASPQLITGTIINGLLFLATERLSKKEIIPLIVLPSLGAIIHGVLFGPQTVFLYYFLPFIWIGNYILVAVFSVFNKQPYSIRIGISAVAKYLILQLFAQLYFKNGIVPAVFVSSMGYIQLITALAGGLLTYGITSILNHERR